MTGATGHVGGAVARALAERGVEQRLLVRSPERAPKLAGAVVRGCSYGDGAAAKEALAGVDTLFMVSASESADRRAQHLTFVDAAAAAGVRQIVYTLVRQRGAGRDLHPRPRPLRDRAADREQRDGVHLPAGQLLPRLHGAVRGGAGRARRPGGRRAGRHGGAGRRGPVGDGRAARPRAARRCHLHADRAGVADPDRGCGAADRRPWPALPVPQRDAGGGVRVPGQLSRTGLAGRGLGDHTPRSPPGRWTWSPTTSSG